MSAGHAENEHFTYDCTSKLKTKFLGNSIDVYPVGRYFCKTTARAETLYPEFQILHLYIILNLKCHESMIVGHG